MTPDHPRTTTADPAPAPPQSGPHQSGLHKSALHQPELPHPPLPHPTVSPSGDIDAQAALLASGIAPSLLRDTFYPRPVGEDPQVRAHEGSTLLRLLGAGPRSRHPWGAGGDAAVRQAREEGYAQAMMRSLANAAASIVNADACVALFEGGVLVRIAATEGRSTWLGSAVPIEGTVCGRAVTGRRTVRLPAPGLSMDVGVRRIGDRPPSPACCPGARSHLAFPLMDDDDLLGLLTLTSASEDWFDDRAQADIAMLTQVAARALAGLPIDRDDTDRTIGFGPGSQGLGLHGLGLWTWDGAHDTARCSPSIRSLLGLRPHDRLSLARARVAVHEEDQAHFDAVVDQYLRDGRARATTLRVRSPLGERQVQVWSEPRTSPDGHPRGVWGAVIDVTGREQEVAALRSSVAGLRAAKELTGLGVWEWHPQDARLEWSDEMYRLLGVEPGDLPPSLELWHQAIHPDDRERAMRLDSLAAEGGGAVATFRVIGFDGIERHIQSWATVVPPDGSSRLIVAGAAVDVTRQVRDRAELDRRSATDPITGLANRVGFERWMLRLLAGPHDVGLLLLDLDRFKMVNDSLGHPVGDRLLVEVARRLEQVAPSGSLTARMGGDEFVVVPPPGHSVEELRWLATEIIQVMRSPITIGGAGENLFCPVSVGVTTSAGRRVGADVLLAEADLALYRAKDQGRDRFAVFDDALRERVRRRHRTEQQLRLAMQQGRLELQYQPIVDVRTDRVVGAEALVRMRSEDGTVLVQPEHFIDVAEDIGLVIDVDCWVIQAALDQLSYWWHHAPHRSVPWLAVNVSPRSMEHPRLLRTVLDGVERRGLPPHLLKIELTESTFLSSALPGGAKALQTLIAAQIPVGIDDFGTGYSALAYLSAFKLDFMKIDRSFVARLGHDARADAVVEAIVALAHAHLMKVTAEGVETSLQAQRLRDMRCDYAQGFHFGRPGDAARILGD